MLKVEEIDLYYGASRALRRVSLTADKGAVTCVLGRNGVGKTSLLRAIVGQHPVKQGKIIWEDEDITSRAPYERAARGIAFVPQGREIFPLLTVEENLRTGFAALPRSLAPTQRRPTRARATLFINALKKPEAGRATDCMGSAGHLIPANLTAKEKQFYDKRIKP